MPATADDEPPREPDPQFAGKPCAYCGRPSEGRYAIHRDGFGQGPEVALCDAHGGSQVPSCAAIWDRIRERRGMT